MQAVCGTAAVEWYMERYGSLAQVGELVGAAPDSQQVVDRVRRLTARVKELQKEAAVRLRCAPRSLFSGGVT